MSEPIIRIQLIYQLQRATVTLGTAWPFTWACTLWISQGLLCRTDQQLLCLWAGPITLTLCRCWAGHLLLDWSGCWAEIWEFALSSRITPQEHKWKIMGNRECNMLCRKRRHKLTTSNSSNGLFSFQLTCYQFKKTEDTLLIHETKKGEKARQSGGTHIVTWGILAVPSIMKFPTIQAIPWTENMIAVLYRETLQLQPTLSLDKVLGLIAMAVCNSPLQAEGNRPFFP